MIELAIMSAIVNLSSLRHVDVISMGVEQKVAYLFPGTFAPGPWTKELNRIAVWLTPVSTRLQRLVELPTQVLLTLLVQEFAFQKFIDSTKAAPNTIPTSFPLIESQPIHSINIDGSSKLMVAEDSRLKVDPNLCVFTPPRSGSKFFKYAFQLSGEFWSNQRITRRRVDSIASA